MSPLQCDSINMGCDYESVHLCVRARVHTHTGQGIDLPWLGSRDYKWVGAFSMTMVGCDSEMGYTVTKCSYDIAVMTDWRLI